jgi:D-beta-D-heptose 7-phosphate kinase/D-beta-D-heptose 1-phosphate adenosyltransferase
MSTAPATPFSGRYLTLEEMVAERQRLKAAGKRLVFTNGCFDILHLGHATYLAWARAQGDALVVAINTDASVRRNKGPKRPIVGQDDRAALLLALRCVDYVILFDEDTPERVIAAIVPDVLVKGRDWAGNVVGSDIVEAAGGEVRLADLVAGRSTTGIIERVLDVYGAKK